MLMSKDSDPRQPQFGIVNAYNYWIEVIQPNWIDYENASTPRKAFNLASSLWSVIEWIQHDIAHGLQHLSPEQIRSHFQEKCQALKIVHDLGTHGKHYTVSRPRSEASVSGSEMTGAIFCFSTPYGPVSEQTADFFVSGKSGEEVPLSAIFRETMNFWHCYFSKPR